MKPPGRPFDIEFRDPVIKAFLGAPKISVATLDSTVFFTRQEVRLTSDQSVNSDHFMRQGLTDAFYSEKLLTIAMQFIPKFRKEMEDHYEGFTSNAVDFLQDILGLIQFSNQRAIHNVIAALTANKTGMREKVLSRFDVPPKTRQMLKYSAFTSQSVFGELPQAFLAKFTGATSQNLVARDRKKNNTGGKGRGKRSYNDNNYNPPGSAKKSKYGNDYQPPQSSVFSKPGPNPKGGGAGGKYGKEKGGGRGRAKN